MDLPVRRAASYWVLLALAFLLPVAGLVVALHTVPDEVPVLAPRGGPLIVEARLVDVTDERPASGALTWTEGPAMSAPAWTGLVTAVAIARGDKVTTGAVLARIDTVDRIAVASPQPFHRPLRNGDRGPDVAMLRSVLAELGYAVEPAVRPDSLDRRMASALRELEARLAHIEVGGTDGVFRPEWFVWLPVDTLTVQEVSLTAGRPAPAPGEVIAAGAPVLATLTVSATSEDARAAPEGTYEFIKGEVVVALTDTLTATGNALTRLTALVRPGEEAVDGRIRLAEARTVLVVPASAVQTNDRGEHCAVRVVGGANQPVKVTVGGGGIGTAEITSGLSAGERVLANPADVGVPCD